MAVTLEEVGISFNQENKQFTINYKTLTRSVKNLFNGKELVSFSIKGIGQNGSDKKMNILQILNTALPVKGFNDDMKAFITSFAKQNRTALKGKTDKSPKFKLLQDTFNDQCEIESTRFRGNQAPVKGSKDLTPLGKLIKEAKTAKSKKLDDTGKNSRNTDIISQVNDAKEQIMDENNIPEDFQISESIEEKFSTYIKETNDFLKSNDEKLKSTSISAKISAIESLIEEVDKSVKETEEQIDENIKKSQSYIKILQNYIDVYSTVRIEGIESLEKLFAKLEKNLKIQKIMPEKENNDQLIQDKANEVLTQIEIEDNDQLIQDKANEVLTQIEIETGKKDNIDVIKLYRIYREIKTFLKGKTFSEYKTEIELRIKEMEKKKPIFTDLSALTSLKLRLEEKLSKVKEIESNKQIKEISDELAQTFQTIKSTHNITTPLITSMLPFISKQDIEKYNIKEYKNPKMNQEKIKSNIEFEKNQQKRHRSEINQNAKKYAAICVLTLTILDLIENKVTFIDARNTLDSLCEYYDQHTKEGIFSYLSNEEILNQLNFIFNSKEESHDKFRRNSSEFLKRTISIVNDSYKGIDDAKEAYQIFIKKLNKERSAKVRRRRQKITTKKANIKRKQNNLAAFLEELGIKNLPNTAIEAGDRSRCDYEDLFTDKTSFGFTLANTKDGVVGEEVNFDENQESSTPSKLVDEFPSNSSSFEYENSGNKEWEVAEPGLQTDANTNTPSKSADTYPDVSQNFGDNDFYVPSQGPNKLKDKSEDENFSHTVNNPTGQAKSIKQPNSSYELTTDIETSSAPDILTKVLNKDVSYSNLFEETAKNNYVPLSEKDSLFDKTFFYDKFVREAICNAHGITIKNYKLLIDSETEKDKVKLAKLQPNPNELFKAIYLNDLGTIKDIMKNKEKFLSLLKDKDQLGMNIFHYIALSRNTTLAYIKSREIESAHNDINDEDNLSSGIFLNSNNGEVLSDIKHIHSILSQAYLGTNERVYTELENAVDNYLMTHQAFNAVVHAYKNNDKYNEYCSKSKESFQIAKDHAIKAVIEKYSKTIKKRLETKTTELETKIKILIKKVNNSTASDQEIEELKSLKVKLDQRPKSYREFSNLDIEQKCTYLSQNEFNYFNNIRVEKWLKLQQDIDNEPEYKNLFSLRRHIKTVKEKLLEASRSVQEARKNYKLPEKVNEKAKGSIGSAFSLAGTLKDSYVLSIIANIPALTTEEFEGIMFEYSVKKEVNTVTVSSNNKSKVLKPKTLKRSNTLTRFKKGVQNQFGLRERSEIGEKITSKPKSQGKTSHGRNRTTHKTVSLGDNSSTFFKPFESFLGEYNFEELMNIKRGFSKEQAGGPIIISNIKLKLSNMENSITKNNNKELTTIAKRNLHVNNHDELSNILQIEIENIYSLVKSIPFKTSKYLLNEDSDSPTLFTLKLESYKQLIELEYLKANENHDINKIENYRNEIIALINQAFEASVKDELNKLLDEKQRNVLSINDEEKNQLSSLYPLLSSSNFSNTLVKTGWFDIEFTDSPDSDFQHTNAITEFIFNNYPKKISKLLGKRINDMKPGIHSDMLIPNKWSKKFYKKLEQCTIEQLFATTKRIKSKNSNGHKTVNILSLIELAVISGNIEAIKIIVKTIETKGTEDNMIAIKNLLGKDELSVLDNGRPSLRMLAHHFNAIRLDSRDAISALSIKQKVVGGKLVTTTSSANNTANNLTMYRKVNRKKILEQRGIKKLRSRKHDENNLNVGNKTPGNGNH